MCGKCLKQDQECSYSSSNKKRGPRQGHIEILEQRLKKMEELMTTNAGSGNLQLDRLPTEPLREYQAAPQGPEPHIEAPLPDIAPSTDVIQHLVDTYFQHCAMIAPIIDVEGFKSSVRNNTCNMFLLYSIMAVAARYVKIVAAMEMSGIKYQ